MLFFQDAKDDFDLLMSACKNLQFVTQTLDAVCHVDEHFSQH